MVNPAWWYDIGFAVAIRRRCTNPAAAPLRRASPEISTEGRRRPAVVQLMPSNFAAVPPKIAILSSSLKPGIDRM